MGLVLFLAGQLADALRIRSMAFSSSRQIPDRRVVADQFPVVALLAMGEPLPEKNRDHDLSGDWVGHRECHIQPDWLLIYRIEDDVLVLTLARTGTHSDLFDK